MVVVDKKSKKTKVYNRDSILESLRGIGNHAGSSFKRDFVEKVPQDAAEMLFGRRQKFAGDLKPNEELSLESRETELQREFQRRLRQQELTHRQEIQVFSAQKEDEKKRIEILQAEVIKLAKSFDNLGQEVKVAAIQQTVNPGTYHETYFQKLISLIKSLRKKVNDASAWLATANKRARKQPFYWRQVKKSGTRYMLSQERYMATQAG